MLANAFHFVYFEQEKKNSQSEAKRIQSELQIGYSYSFSYPNLILVYQINRRVS